MKKKSTKKNPELVVKLDVDHFVMEDYPWRDPIKENELMYIFRDGFPVTELGHFLFVPKTNDMDNIAACLIAATKQGASFVEEEYCEGFNIGMNYGASAGQTVDWPHVHLILRSAGDCANPKGGVRNVIPGKGDYTSNENTTTDFS
jgi:diadenosine tetraphosphate (Ap4A) HIT family hydrolase